MNSFFQTIKQKVESEGFMILNHHLKCFENSPVNASSAIIEYYAQNWLSNYELLCDLVIEIQQKLCFQSKLYRSLISGIVQNDSDKTCNFDKLNIKEIKPICLYKCSHSVQEIQKNLRYKIRQKRQKYINKALIEKRQRYKQEKSKRLKMKINVLQQKQSQNQFQKSKQLPKAIKKLKFNEISDNGFQEIAQKPQVKNNQLNVQIKQIKQQNEAANKNLTKNCKKAHSKEKSKQSKKDIQKKELQKQSKFLSSWISKSKTY